MLSRGFKRVLLGAKKPGIRCCSEDFRSEPWMVGNLTEIGTRAIFSEEHDMFRESVRRFFQVSYV